MDDELELYDFDGDPRSRCGPYCEHWGGDGLCMLEIKQLASEAEMYERLYVHPETPCPFCGKVLTMYDIASSQLWVWPGLWPGGGSFNPMIALGIYAVYGAPKGEYHMSDGVVHVWIGEGDGREEKLIHLLGECNLRAPAVAVEDDGFPF